MTSSTLEWPSWPSYNEQDHSAVLDVIQSNQLFAASKVKEFEIKFAQYTNSPYSVAVGNATQGLHLALAALSIGVGDEVIVPNYSFISSASCVLMQNAIPIFVDCDSSTLAPTVDMIREKVSERTKAVIVTHLWGFPCHIKAIQDFCKANHIFLIEDCSHAHGATVNDQHVGTFSDIAVFSLHQRKNLPVGDGGICLMKNEFIRNKIYRLRSFGDSELSYNYRMTEFAGALGTSRLSLLDQQNQERRLSADMLNKIIDDIPWLDYIKPLSNCIPVYHAYILLINPDLSPVSLEDFVSGGNKVGIPFKQTWRPLHSHPHFNPVSEPARGLPWVERSLPNSSYVVPSYISQEFPNSDFLIYNSIVQLDIHPGVTAYHVESVHRYIRSLP